MPSGDGPKRMFLAGKGGVGKTTLAVAAAVSHARQGKKTLLVTTDPAAHIGKVLECEVAEEPGAVPGVVGLDATRIDPHAETRRYKEAVLAEARMRYDEPTVRRVEEELNSPCTEEVAVFRRFLDHLLADCYDVVVFDTAPTGHTLRLLELPLSYSRQIAAKASGDHEGSRGEDAEAARMGQALELLRDPDRTTLAFVVSPEATPIAEAARASAELRQIGIATSLVFANLVLPEEVCEHPLFQRRRAMQMRHLWRIPDQFPGAVLRVVHLQERDVVGMEAILRVAAEAFGETSPAAVS